MKVEEIERLLTLYYEGETSETQEALLRTYFETEKVPKHLQKDRKMFASFRKATRMETSVGLENKLIQMIDAKEEEEKRFFHRNKSKRNWRWIGSIAASLMLMIGISYSIYQYQYEIKEPKDTFTNPQDAYKVLQATLIEVSTDLNSGVNQLSETRTEINNINQEIKKQIK